MKFYDVSALISQELPVYEGDPAVAVSERSEIAKGAPCNVSLISFGSHTGTHIDVPYHFLQEGKKLDELPLEHFMGRAKLFDLTGRGAVSAADLEKLPIEKGDIVLLKTDNSQNRLLEKGDFHRDYVYVSEDGAEYLTGLGVKGVGVDYLSVEQFGSQSHKTHKTLLGAGLLIVEGLALADVPEGEYTLMALPLKIKGGNGSPVRAVLIAQ